MRTATSATLVLLAFSTLAACGQDGSGTFEVSGVQKHELCLDDVFPLEVGFMALRTRADSTGVFLQRDPGTFYDADMVLFEVFDMEGARGGESLELVTPGGEDIRAQGEVFLSQSCPDIRDSLWIDGTVVFDEFGTLDDDLVTGHIEEASIRSARDDQVVARELTGQWTFAVKKGPPYESFRSAPSSAESPFR